MGFWSTLQCSLCITSPPRQHGATSPLPSQISAHRALPLPPPPEQHEEHHDSLCRGSDGLMADTTGTSWADIPLDLAGQILHRLPAHVDRVRFAAVCLQWRAATRHGPLPTPPPLPEQQEDDQDSPCRGNPPPEQQEEDHDSPCRGSDRRMTDTTGTSWSDIPLDLADRILRHLPAHVDRVRFAAVCVQWCAATRHGPLPTPLPLLLISDTRVYSLPGSEPFHFPGFTGTGCIDACGDWLVFSRKEGLFLRDPFSNVTVKLPPLSHVRTRLVGIDVDAVWSQAPSTAAATLHVLGIESLDVATLAWMEMAETLKLEEEEPKSCQLLLCSSDLIVATINFRGGKRIAVCQPGATSWWSVWVENIGSNFADMAFHQGKLYAINIMATLFTIDVGVDHSSGDPWISQIQKVIDGPCLHMSDYLHPRERAYLVESRGVLLVVLRRLHQHCPFEADAAEFKVFEADLNRSQWLKVTTIGNNEILFLRRRCSRSVCVPHNMLPGDSIFFLEDVWYSSLGSGSCRVYSLTEGRVSNPLPTVSWEHVMTFGAWLFPQN